MRWVSAALSRQFRSPSWKRDTREMPTSSVFHELKLIVDSSMKRNRQHALLHLQTPEYGDLHAVAGK